VILAGLTAWAALWLMYERVPYEERLPARWVLQLMPFVVGAQVALDVMVPFTGDIAIVLGMAWAVNDMLRRRVLPQARVMSSRVTARAASTCVGARRAS
jgi:hypothetical protein